MKTSLKYFFATLIMMIAKMGYATSNVDTSAVNQVTTDTTVTTVSQSTSSFIGNPPDVNWSISFSNIFWALVIFFLTYIVIKYLTIFLEALAEKWSNLRLAIKRIIPIFRIAGWTTVLYIIIAWIFAPPIETLIALTASTGIAIGFASQDILKNIFGGIMILFDRPFQVGDKIEVGNHYGEVISIGLRTVRITTPDDSLVSIPNSEIVNQSVSNANAGESNCQVVAELFLPTDVDIEMIKKMAYQAAAVSRYVFLKKAISVLVKNEIHYGRTVLKLRVKAYVMDIRYEFQFMSDITETMIRELALKGITVSSNKNTIINEID